MFRIIVFLLACVMFLSGCGREDAGEANDPLRGQLTVYTALEDDELAIYTAAFQARYPDIELNIVRDSTGVITARLLAERDNPQADVVWGLAVTSLLVCDQQGMLAGYTPEGIDLIDERFRDIVNENAHWVGIKAWMTAFIGNTVELEANGLEMPRSFADLLSPQYRGHLVMPNPDSSGTGFLTVAAILQYFGEEAGWEYLDGLHENMAMYMHSGSQPARMAARGEFPIGISFGYRGFKQLAQGDPVEVVFPAEGAGWELEANALVRRPVIKACARTFLDWAISEEAMTLYGTVYPTVTREGTEVSCPEGWPEDTDSLMMDIDLLWEAENRDRILREWRRRYDGRSAPR